MNIVDKLLTVDPEVFGKAEEREIPMKRLSKLLGEPFSVCCRGISGGRFTEISSTAVDDDGDVAYDKAFDVHVRLALAGMVSPDLKDKQLLEHYHCPTPKDLLLLLFNGGEIAKIADEVTDLSGYGKDSDKKIKN